MRKRSKAAAVVPGSALPVHQLTEEAVAVACLSLLLRDPPLHRGEAIEQPVIEQWQGICDVHAKTATESNRIVTCRV